MYDLTLFHPLRIYRSKVAMYFVRILSFYERLLYTEYSNAHVSSSLIFQGTFISRLYTSAINEISIKEKSSEEIYEYDFFIVENNSF